MNRKKTIIVFDDKSELRALSRAKRNSGSVFAINPFECLGGRRKGFDALKRLDPQSRTFGADADSIAEALIPLSSDARGYIA